MYILGISAFYHDSAAALIKDGEIIFASSEERYTRQKGTDVFPINAINNALKFANITLNEIERIVFYDKPIIKFDRIIASYIHRSPLGVHSFIKAIPLWLKKKLWVEDTIKKELKFKESKYKKDILFTEHHQSHAASAFYPSPFEEAAILTVDGAGEWTTTTIGIGKNNKISLLKKIEFPHSLGLLYSAFTYYCGFRVNSGEYKLMGLAPYGEPRYADIIKKKLITLNQDGAYILNEKYFNYVSGLKMVSDKFIKLFEHPPCKSESPSQFYMDIAASIQVIFEEAMLNIAREAKKVTGLNKLCLAGGSALNCVANSKILEMKIFDDIWVQPAANDSGGALGAALYCYYDYFKNNRNIPKDDNGVNIDSQKGSLLGNHYTDGEIEQYLTKFGTSYQKLDSDTLTKKVANLISEGNVVGWFQGRMEYGPRALGSRSILGDARDPNMQSLMNKKIKFRESFRPFAPAVLEEYSSEYFYFDRASPYMLFVADLKEKYRNKVEDNDKTGLELLKIHRSIVPAITHVDFSARLQTVNRKDKPLFYKLIKEFYNITKIPIIINTSFNVRGEPIVESPLDAYYCFMGTNIDYLAIGSFLLSKKDQPKLDLKKWKKRIIQD